MANLYEIEKEIMNCFDAETGEVLDIDRLTELQMDAEEKIEHIALWVKNLNSDIAAYKAEEDVFASRRKVAERKVESLKNWLALALEGHNISTARYAITFRNSEATDIIDDTKIPENFWRVTTKREPDRVAIKAALKNGIEVPGCGLKTNTSVAIK